MEKSQKMAKNAQLGGKIGITKGKMGHFRAQNRPQNRGFTEGNLGQKRRGVRASITLKRPF